MILVDLTLPTPEENLAYDEALLNDAEKGGPEALRFWESPQRIVVLGSTGRIAEEVQLDACRAKNIPVLRRASGGGTVLAGPGCLFYSLILNLDERVHLRDIHVSYREISNRIADCLQLEGLAHRGISDIALGARKISGNAQRRKSRSLLHHGTILYRFDLKEMEEFLKDPPKQPDYREHRGHAEFTANLPLSAEEIKSRMIRCWEAQPSQPPRPDLSKLIEEKYGNRSWIERL
jgi:lipoate-protein ligase A